jgi:hypothetical protein
MDVAAWLRGLGLEQYAPAFGDNDVDGEVLPKLAADDLISIGVSPSFLVNLSSRPVPDLRLGAEIRATSGAFSSTATLILCGFVCTRRTDGRGLYAS